MGKRRPARPDPTPLRTLHGAVVVAEVDLHGLTVEQAERRVEGFLRAMAVREPGQVVRVITGRGRGSPGRPVVRDAVLDALRGWLSELVDDWGVDGGGGAYLVRTKG